MVNTNPANIYFFKVRNISIAAFFRGSRPDVFYKNVFEKYGKIYR